MRTSVIQLFVVVYAVICCVHPLDAQLATGTATTAKYEPPDEMLILITNDKVSDRPLPGLEKFGYIYNYDQDNSPPGERRHFQIGMSSKGVDFGWRLYCRLKQDGELFPLLGQMYRWNSESSKLVRIPDEPHNLTCADWTRRISLTGSVVLGQKDGRSIRVGVEKYQPESDVQDEDRVKVTINASDGQSVTVPVGSADQPHRYWLKQGDHVGTQFWDLTLSRIVNPNPEEKNPGWIDLTVDVLPTTKKNK